MTGNHLMLLLFSSVLSVCRGCRGRFKQSSLIGNSVNIRLYRLTLFVGRIGVCPIPAHNECMASERCCELDHISILLDPVINVHQRRSALRLGTLHESRDVYPAMIWLYLQLKVRPIGARYGAGLVSTLWISVECIFSWKKNSSANWPCLNKAFLSSLTELSDLCKCLCHS